MSAAPVLELPRRYARTVYEAERRVWCPYGHVFTPDRVLHHGRGTIRCRQCRGSDLLLIAVLRELRTRIIVEVTREELERIDALPHVRPGVDLLWLVLQPLGEAKLAV